MGSGDEEDPNIDDDTKKAIMDLMISSWEDYVETIDPNNVPDTLQREINKFNSTERNINDDGLNPVNRNEDISQHLDGANSHGRAELEEVNPCFTEIIENML